MNMEATPTKLDYYNNMFKLQSISKLVAYLKGDDGRRALILESTIFHPQGGGQPSDTGFITVDDSDIKFIVQDVRSKDGIVFHYGIVDNSGGEFEMELEKGKEVQLCVDEPRRMLNSRLSCCKKYTILLILFTGPLESKFTGLHSAGHLLDVCMEKVGLGHLEPGKGYHFPDGPFVEYKGTVPQNELQSKTKELELEANALISRGGKVFVAVLPYDKASLLCGGCLPDYIPQGSTPRIVKLGDNPGCPCGGTHVSDISEIVSMTVSQIRTKKGMTKVFYSVGS